MRCARCLDMNLTTEEFQGNIIDSCPRCHGVWLSRHDFDTLIARRPAARPRPEPYYEPRHDRHSSHDSSARLPVARRRTSWIADLFD